MESKSLTSSFARPRRLIAAASLASAAFVMCVVPSLASADSAAGKLTSAAATRKAAKQDPNAGTRSAAARRAMRQGYLVPNQRHYDRQKARITRRSSARDALTAPVTMPSGGQQAPVKLRAWAGINNPNNAPPDETSAVGTTRYIELVNSNFAIYNKTGNTPVGTGTLNSLVGAGGGVDVFDPQIMWDGQTKRFYFAADAVVSASDNEVAFGFSKTATPTTAADWCKYSVGFGATFPDYPKLGDSQNFAIIGSNQFNSSGGFLGSHIEAISKPPAGTTCPSAGSFKAGGAGINGGFTPTPASEIDTNPTGWAVAVTLSTPGSKLQLYKVTRNATTGNPVIATTPTSVTVPSYNIPPSVPQKGTAFRIDSSDTRNTQAQAGIDPGHGSKFAIWTQHTVNVGGRAAVRWYEINPATHTLFQSGTVSSPSLFEFNGAIAPNRQVNGATKSGGNAMVMNFNTSSTATFPSIKMVSKIGGGAQSGQVAVFNGTKPLTGFDCTATAPDPCRWGDYAAATPDPSTANRIWNVSQYGNGTPSSTFATSKTWNFIAQP
jgi:hypothetical protein